MKPDFSHASQSFRARNPHLFGLGGLRPAVPESNSPSALDRPAPRKKGRRESLEDRSPTFRVSLVVGRDRLLDSDNLVGSLKGLRDAIAETLGLDDADKFIDWKYGQFRTDQQGVLVKIEQLDYL